MAKWRKHPLPLDYPRHPERRPALVLGASSGIGRATAVALAEAGHPVAVGARRVDRLDEVVAHIREAGGEAEAFAVDVTDENSIASAVTDVEASLGEIEVVVNSAGSLRMGRVWEMTPDDFSAQVDVHLLAAHRVVAAVVPGMVSRGRGDVVLIGSNTSRTARPRSGAYPAAKSAVDTMAFQLQSELEGTGVRATVVRPGPVATEMGTDFDEDTIVDVINDWVKFGHGRHGRMCTPAQLAHGVVAAVSLSRGAYVRELEIQPEAPIES